MNNHVIDPTYFWQGIEIFSFDYPLFIVTQKEEVDEYGITHKTYEEQTIRGSFQTQGMKIRRSKTGNTNENDYNFYCKSLYRINIGDILKHKENYYICNSIHDYDEYGVREASLSMINLTAYRDFDEWLKYKYGEEFV